MATKKPKKTDKKSSSKSKAATVKTAKTEDKPKTVGETTKNETVEAKAKTEKKENKNTKEAKETEVKEVAETAPENKKLFAGFFAKKYEGNESILTIFKSHKIYGALLGELIGTMLIAMIMLTMSMMGVASIAAYAVFGLIAIVASVVTISGANLNPLVTVGMMATRRISAIRGVVYIVAQIVGAWLGLLVVNGFRLAGGEAAELTTMSEIADGGFWMVAMIEFLGAAIIGFFFARAQRYKCKPLPFAVIVVGGMVIALLVGYVISAAFLGLNNNFAMNPAVALMYQILPTTADNAGELFGGIFSALCAYVIIPMVGGVLGFYLSDSASRLSDECACDCCCKKKA